MSREGYAKSQKIAVTCKTCGISESFYSTISVKHFKLNHAGHDVIEELPGGQVVREVPSSSPQPGNGKSSVAPQPPEVPAASEAEVRLPRVMVELAAFPALSRPVFRIRGIREDGSEAFVQVLVFEEGTRVRDIIAKGSYLDKGFTEQLYVWSPEAVEYDDEVKHLLGLRTRAGAEVVEESEMPKVAESTVRGTTEEIFGTAPRREASKVRDAVFPSFLAAPPLENEPNLAPQKNVGQAADRVSDWRPEPVAEAEAPRPEPARVAPPVVPAPAPPAPRAFREPEPTVRPAVTTEPVPELKPEPKKPEAAAPKPKPKPAHKPSPKEAPPPEKETEGLLVSKSWYIQGGQANKKEALRLSRVLSAFRWRVEPIYTLGVMLDDIVSIESTRNEISGTLIRSVEEAGYHLSAVTSDQGKVVAWFKRAGPGEPPSEGESAGGQAPSEGSQP